MSVELAIAIAQLLAGLLLLITTGIAGWTLRQVVSLRSDFERLKGRVKAESEGTDRRFLELRDWLQTIATKLDTLIMGLLKNKGPN